VDGKIHRIKQWVLSSVRGTMTYHALLGYLECVSMLSAILVPPADGGGKMAKKAELLVN